MTDFDSSSGPTPPPEPEPVSPQHPAPAPGPILPPRRHQRRLPEDVYTPWGWAELLTFLAFGLGSIILLSVLFWLVVRFEVKPADFNTFAKTNAPFNALFMTTLYATLILYLYVTIHVGRQVSFLRTIGWRDWRSARVPRAALYALFTICGMALAVVVAAGSTVFKPKENLPIQALFHDPVGVLWLAAAGILVAPAVEETIFRGYLYPVLARSLGVWGGILVTGLLFGMIHAHQLWGGWAQIGLLIFVGVVLTYARARTGTVLTSWLLHVGYNSFLFAAYFISTGGLRHLPPTS